MILMSWITDLYRQFLISRQYRRSLWKIDSPVSCLPWEGYQNFNTLLFINQNLHLLTKTDTHWGGSQYLPRQERQSYSPDNYCPAFPSQRDVDYAFYLDSLILIISFMEDKVPQIGAFQIENGKIEKKVVKIMGEK
jgi:hypothetical protein